MGRSPPPDLDRPMPPPPAVRRALVGWYRRAARDLPWRRSPSPYAVWISETMLQQTQVDRVKDYFTRFMTLFPTVAALAAADADDVLRAWEGLGYYRRARQLHAAARRVVTDHDGILPADERMLRGLPGIGRYTAGAILSIAHDRPAPIVEANSRRVLARLVGHAAPLGGSAGDEPLWQVAARLVPRRGAGTFNQALMDLGATVCIPKRPSCGRCPLASLCVARATGRTAGIPAMATRRTMVERRETALVACHRGRVLLRRRAPGEWWEGLWDFPRLPAADLVERLSLGPARTIARLCYTVTHHRVALRVVSRAAARPGRSGADRMWVVPNELERFALTAPGRRIARLVASRHRAEG